MARTPASYYVKYDTYWQGSPDRFAGPYDSREQAEDAVITALNADGSKATMFGRMASDARHGICIYGVLNRSEARRNGLRLDWDAQRNCTGQRIPINTDELFDLEQAV